VWYSRIWVWLGRYSAGPAGMYMPLNPSDRTFLKQTYQDLADKPLLPGSPFYEPVYRALELDDPV
jgi:hypothetical protein